MNNLRSVLQTHLAASYHPINTIPSTCCYSSSFSVIDFDEVKRQFCRIVAAKKELKSADCLHIDETKRILCFVEMKNASAYIAAKRPNAPDEQTFIAEFNAWLESLKHELRAKVAESIFIIVAALGLYSPGTSDIKEILDRNDVKLRYVVLAHLTSADYLTYSLSSLHGNGPGSKDAISFGLLAGNRAEAFITTADDFDNYVAAYL